MGSVDMLVTNSARISGVVVVVATSNNIIERSMFLC